MKTIRRRNRTASPIRAFGWALAALIALWLLNMTLRPVGSRNAITGIQQMLSDGVPLGLGRAFNEINLIPFSQKSRAFDCLLADCRWQASAGRFLFIDVLGNVAVFAPLGVGLALAHWPAQKLSHTLRRRPSLGWPLGAGLLGGLFSLGIELGQLLIPGRATDVDDVILNTAGALLGAGLVWLLYPILIRGHHD